MTVSPTPFGLLKTLGNRAARRALRSPSDAPGLEALQRKSVDINGTTTVSYDLATYSAGAVLKRDEEWISGWEVKAENATLTRTDGGTHYLGIIQNANGAREVSEVMPNGKLYTATMSTGGWTTDSASDGDLPWYNGDSRGALAAGENKTMTLNDEPTIPFAADSTQREVTGTDNFEWWLVHSTSAAPAANGDVRVLESGTVAVDWGAGTEVDAQGGANATPRAYAAPTTNAAIVTSLVEQELDPPPPPADDVAEAAQDNAVAQQDQSAPPPPATGTVPATGHTASE